MTNKKRSYTEKDLILRIDELEKKIDELTDALGQISDKIDDEKSSSRKYVYGIKGIAALFGCSTATAQRIKSSGVIDGAIKQRNRRIICDAQKALELYDDPFVRLGVRVKSRPKY